MPSVEQIMQIIYTIGQIKITTVGPDRGAHAAAQWRPTRTVRVADSYCNLNTLPSRSRSESVTRSGPGRGPGRPSP
jgi:hypothetical protein